MTTWFVGFIPGAVDRIGSKYGLSFNARSLLRWLCETADRASRKWEPASFARITEATCMSWRTARPALEELDRAGCVKYSMPRGHDGWVQVDEWVHGEIVYRKVTRNRDIATRNRGNATRNRDIATRSRVSAITNRDNTGKRDRRSLTDNEAGPSSPALVDRDYCDTCNGSGWLDPLADTLEPCECRRAS